MNRKIIVGIAMAMGMLTVGAVSASAAGSCCDDGTCGDKQVFQKFTRETSVLSAALKAKDLELREQYGYEGIDLNRVGTLEAEIKELKGRIKVVAEKQGVPACCHG